MFRDRKNWIGGLLILFGAVLLLEQFNILTGVPALLWGALLVLIGAALMSDHLRLPGAAAWKVFPGMALIGMGIESMLPHSLKMLDGVAFLAAMGAAFVLFMQGTKRSWWAVIPAGVFFSLALTNLVDNVTKFDAGGIFLIGLGVTFFVLALVSIQGEKREWGFIPGSVLVILGALEYTTKFNVSWDYLLPGILILAGLLFLLRSFTSSRR